MFIIPTIPCETCGADIHADADPPLCDRCFEKATQRPIRCAICGVEIGGCDLCAACAGLGVAPRLTPPEGMARCPLCAGRGHVGTNTPAVDPKTGRNVPGVVYPR